MAAIFAAADRVERLTDEYPSLSVAAYNGANTVLSGPGGDLERAVARLTADGVRCDWLDTSHAFHSALLDPALDAFETYADQFTFAAPQRILVCNRTGTALGRTAKLDGAYWRRHARQPVEFAKSVATLSDLGCAMLLEVGPQPVLTAAAAAGLARSGQRAKGGCVHATQRIRPPPYRRGGGQHLCRRAPARLRGAAGTSGAQAGSAHLPVRAPAVLVPRQAGAAGQEGCRSHRRRPRFSRTAGSRSWRRCWTTRGTSLTTADVLNKLATQHNRQRDAQSISDARYEIRWLDVRTGLRRADR